MKHLWSSGLHRGDHSDVLNDAIIWARKMNPKKVEIFSKDKLKLVAHIIEAENARGSILLMHGFHSSGIHDFSLALQPSMAFPMAVEILSEEATSRSF